MDEERFALMSLSPGWRPSMWQMALGWVCTAISVLLTFEVAWALAREPWYISVPFAVVMCVTCLLQAVLMRRRYQMRRVINCVVIDDEGRVGVRLIDPKRVREGDAFYGLLSGVKQTGGNCRVRVHRLDEQGAFEIIDWEFENPMGQPY